MKMLDTSKTTWNLTPLFLSADDPRIKEISAQTHTAITQFCDKWRDRDDYLKDPQVLLSALDEYEKLQRDYGDYDREAYYFSLLQSLDQADPKLKALNQKITDKYLIAKNDQRFFFHRIARIPLAQQNEFLSFAGLAKYRHLLKKTFEEGKYLLSEGEEKVLSMSSQSSYSAWVNMVQEFIGSESIKGETFETLMGKLHSNDRAVRNQANKSINSILDKHAKTAEHEINSILNTKKVNDDLRKIERPDLVRHLSDDIETTVVDSLIKTVADNFNISHRWYTLRAKLMGRNKIDYHDRIARIGAAEKEFSFENGASLVSKVFHHLDDEFASIFDSFVNHGQIDVYPKKDKSGGGFCTHLGLNQPSYILLNWTNKLNDVVTLAHEAGHGINNELMRKVRHSLDFGTPLSTAEVASTFCEDFVFSELLKNVDEKSKLSLLINKIDQDIASIFRQVALYRFEQELHQQYRQEGYLSLKAIGDLFVKHMSAYCGKSVLFQKGHQNWWIYWSHIRNFFYVYSYASGLLISKSLQNEVKKNPTFINRVKEFLAAGESDSPKNIFAKLDIDITNESFWKKGLAEINTSIDEIEKLAQKAK